MATFGLYSAICYGLTLSAVAIYSVGSWHAPTFNDIADGRPSSVKFCWGHRPPTLRGSICFRLLAYGGPPVFIATFGWLALAVIRSGFFTVVWSRARSAPYCG